MAEIYDKAESFKAALLKRERAASSQMVRAYGQAWKRLSKLLLALTEQIGDAASKNEPISPAWLYRQERYARLMNEIERQIKRFAATAEQSILREQRAAVRVALKNSADLVRATAPEIGASFISLNVSAVENIVGFLSNGAPLTRLLDELPGDAGRRTAEALTEAVTLGYNPRKTAAKIRHTLGMTLTRALTIARTETLRSYREATHANYRANEDVVGGWYWAATLGPRTCAACIAMHGTFHSLDERLAAHVNCRCTQIPAIKGRPSPIAQDGEQWFAAQPDAVKARILGTQVGFKAYQAGDLALTDLVGLQSSAVWGQAYHQLGVGRAKAGQGRHPGYGGGPKPVGALPVNVLPDLPPAFVPAQTIKEAEEWIVAQGVTKAATYAGLHLEDVNRVNRTLSEAWQSWQLDPLRHINNVVKGSTRARASGQRLEFNPLELGGPARDLIYQRDVLDYSRLAKEREIRLERLLQGPLTEQQRAEFTASLGKVRESLKYGRWSVKTSADDAVANTFLHETGHVIADQYLGHTNEFVIKNVATPGVLDEARKWKAEWLNLFQQRGEDAYKISQYAVTNEREYFAECFVMYNGERAKLPKRIVDYFDKLKAYANKKPVSKL